MQRTLLQVVQSYLNRTDGFFVDSIYDTDESQQVALIAEQVYYTLCQNYSNLLYLQKDMPLESLGDPTKPNYLLIPQNLQRIQESRIWYNTAEDDEGQTVFYREVKYITPLEFNDMTANRDDKADNAQVVDTPNGTKLVIENDKWPEYCTSYDGVTVVFDSFNSEYDTTLQASKSKVVATEEPVFLQEDDFLIPIPDRLSETYLSNVLHEAYSALRQEENPTLAQRARRDRIRLQQDSREMGAAGRPKTRMGRRLNIQQYGRRRSAS